MNQWSLTIQQIVEANNLDLHGSIKRLQNTLSDDASVGEFGLDVRVSHVADSIDGVLKDNRLDSVNMNIKNCFNTLHSRK